jgi:hypothetical protein
MARTERDERGKTQRQHFVPQSYLGRFHVEQDRRRVFCFDIESGEIELKPIKKVAVENWFFGDPTADTVLEAGFSKVENLMKKIGDKLTSQNTKGLGALGDNEIDDLTIFIALQELRTRASRDMIKRFPTILGGKEMEEEWAKQFHEGTILDWAADNAELIRSKRWTLWENKTSVPLWTSDHPVVRNHLLDSFGRVPSLKSRWTAIYFPLSPCHLLFLYDSRINLDLAGGVKDRDVFQVCNGNAKFIREQNWLQVVSCSKFVFSNSSDFDHAKEIVARRIQNLSETKNLD